MRLPGAFVVDFLSRIPFAVIVGPPLALVLATPTDSNYPRPKHGAVLNATFAIPFGIIE